MSSKKLTPEEHIREMFKRRYKNPVSLALWDEYIMGARAMKEYISHEVADKDALLNEALTILKIIRHGGAPLAKKLDDLINRMNKTTGSEAGSDEQ